MRIVLTMRRRFRASLVAVAAGLTLLSSTSAHADDPVIFRLWGQPPLFGNLMFTRESSGSSTTVFRLLGGTLGVELPQRIVVEAGGGVLVTPVGGEAGLKTGADSWGRAGWAPVIHSTRSDKRAWDFQLIVMGGYRYLERTQIVFEDYGVADQHIHGLTLDGGVMATRWARGAGFSLRLMSGVLIPVAQSTTNESGGRQDKAPTRMQFAIPIGFELGVRVGG